MQSFASLGGATEPGGEATCETEAADRSDHRLRKPLGRRGGEKPGSSPNMEITEL